MTFVFENKGGVDDSGRPIPAYGFEHDGIFITNPYLSDCGRFAVDPAIQYQMTHAEAHRLYELNMALGVIR